MKKDSIKNFAKKVLTVGFCVPVAFVCSAVPAMAATEAQGTTSTATEQPVSGQIQTDSAQLGTAGKAENTNSRTENSAIGGGSADQSGNVTKIIVVQKIQAGENTESSTASSAEGVSENTGQALGARKRRLFRKTKQPGDQILGEARNYGIVCDNYTQTYDAETNIAAKEAKTNPGQHTGNDLTARKEQTFLIGKVDGNFGIKGNKATVVTPDANGAGLYDGTYTIDSSKTKEEIEAKIDQLKRSALQRLDDALRNAQEAKVGRAENDNQKWCLDLGKDPGTYKVSIKDKDVFSGAGKLDIKINADTQAVILSVDDSLISENGILDFASYNINEQGCADYNTGNYGDKPAKAIIWDLRNSKLKTINFGTSSGNGINGSSNGIFIAPNADINLNSTSSGWIICKNMYVGNGEWHNIDQSETLAPEDNPTTPGEDTAGGNKGGSETVKPGNENENKDKPDTSNPDTGESGKPSDSGKTDTPSVENPSGHNENENAGGSSTEIKNTDKPSETGKDKTEEEKPTEGNKEEPTKTDNTTGTSSEDTKSPSTPSIDTPTAPTTPVVTPITPTPTLPSENTGEKNNSQNTNPKTNDNQTTPGTNTGDQKGSTTQTKHNDAQDNHSAAGTDTAAGQTTGTQTVKAHEQNAKSTAPAVQTSTSTASASAAKSTIPRTADETRLGAELMLFGGAAAALAAALLLKRKENE